MRAAAVGGLTALALTLAVGSAASGPWQDGGGRAGYLSASRIAILASAVPAPPAPGSIEEAADQATSHRLTALENSDRWLLATRHAELRPGVALAHFDCALGFRIEASESPRLLAVLTRVLHYANGAAELAKARVHRPRPVADDPDRRPCQVVTPAQRATASHPSGSAAVGAAYGAVLAALVPDRAEAATEVGRQIAVSRMVCAMHYPSDVQQGMMLGEQVAQAILSSPTFAADAELAREEIALARSAGRTSPACAAERAALAIPLP
jgi:acid phosphatase (class A)